MTFEIILHITISRELDQSFNSTMKGMVLTLYICDECKSKDQAPIIRVRADAPAQEEWYSHHIFMTNARSKIKLPSLR